MDGTQRDWGTIPTIINNHYKITNICHALHSQELYGPVFKRAHTIPVYANNCNNTISKGMNGRFVDHASANSSFISRMCRKTELKGHRGCVNTIQWDEQGTTIITGSDDQRINIYSAGDCKLRHSIVSGHSGNVFCAHFVPKSDNAQVVSCAMDGEIRHHHVHDPSANKLLFSSDGHMAFKFQFLPWESGPVFMCTHQDGTVRLFDLRAPTTTTSATSKNVIIDLRKPRNHTNTDFSVYSLACDPLGSPKFVVACADPIVRQYDMRAITPPWKPGKPGCVSGFAPRHVFDKMGSSSSSSSSSSAGVGMEVDPCYVTGVHYGRYGEIAATYSRENLYVFDTLPSKSLWNSPDDPTRAKYNGITVQTTHQQVFKGHRNARTFLKEVAFLGDDRFVATGSDCGHLFIWDRSKPHHNALVQMLPADENIVNGVVPHPHTLAILTCGIDSTGKLWEFAEESSFVKDKAASVVRDNVRHEESERVSMLQLWRVLSRMRRAPPTNNDLSSDDSEGESPTQGTSQEGTSDEGTTEEGTVDPNVKLNEADRHRLRGNEHYQRQHYPQALHAYDQMMSELDSICNDQLPDEVKDKKRKAVIACRSNRAAVNLKLAKYDQVIADCTAILAEDNNNIKALFRRAQAHLAQKNYEEAVADLSKANTLAPADPDVAKQLQLAKQKLQKHTNKMKAAYKSLFTGENDKDNTPMM